MSSSPFELFRRNLKPMMVFLTLLALVSFVILPSVAMYQQQQMGGGNTETRLATFNDGDFEFNKVNYFTRNHFATTQFLAELAETTIARGGVPKVADFQYDTQQGTIQALGINSNPGDQASVRTLMFAAEAKKAGLDLDDTAIRNWLNLYTDDRLSDSEINGVLARSSRNQLGQTQLYEQLRTQLLAQAYQRMVMSGLTSSGMPIVPPAKQWELFLRLNRQAIADAYAVNVADFVDKTNAKPPEKLIVEVYEEGKSVYPDDQSPKPGFRRPYQANFEYLVGDLNEFVAREVATLTEEQLRAEYQRRLDGGDFKVPEPPAAPQPPQDAPAGLADPAAATAADPPADAASGSAPAEKMPEAPESSDSPAAPSPPTDTPAAQTPAAAEPPSATPAVDEPAEEKPAEDQPAESPAAESPAATPEEPSEADSSRRLNTRRGVRLVAMQAPSDSDSPADDTTPPEDQTPADATDNEPPAVADPVQADSKPDEPAKADDPAKPAQETMKSAAEATDTKASEDKPAEDKPAEDKPAEDKPAAPAVEPFDKVRDDIARSLAMQPALDKLDAAVTAVDKAMSSHFKARAIAGGKAGQVPPRPELKALAEKLGMKHVVTGMQDGREIQQDPIALSAGVGTGMQRGAGFVQTMYASRPPAPLFSSVRTVDDQAQASYISWKIEQQAAYIPELKEIREEVITAIRTAEARTLARAEADRLAKEFNASDKPVKELIPAERSSLFFESLGPFSWMNSLGFGMRAFMGNVPELDRVGEVFMRQVFTSERNTWSLAANMPETVYYVVRPTEFMPSTEELHSRFTQASQRMQTMSLAVEEAIKIRDGHYEALDRRTGFEWNEAALEDE